MLDKRVEASMQLKIGIIPKGKTGCGVCDMKGFLTCKCRKDKEGNEEEEEKKDEKSNRSMHKIPELKLTLNSSTNSLSKEELDALYDILYNLKIEFEKFKKEVSQRGVSTNGYKSEIREGALILAIPSAQHHDEFIHRLIEKNRLPGLNVAKENKQETRNQPIAPQRTFHPTPFSMKNKPKGFE